MEEFLDEVRAYAATQGVKPDTVVQSAANLSGLTWRKWEQGKSFPRYDTVEKIRRYIRNPSVGSSCPEHGTEDTQSP